MAHTWPLMRGKSFASYRMYLQAKKVIKNANEIIVAVSDICQTIWKRMRQIGNRANKRQGSWLHFREIDSISMMIEAAKKIDFKVIIAGDGILFPDIYRGPFTEKELIGEISVMFAMYDSDRLNIKSGAIPTKMLDAAAHGIPSVVSKALCEEEGLGFYGNIDK